MRYPYRRPDGALATAFVLIIGMALIPTATVASSRGSAATLLSANMMTTETNATASDEALETYHSLPTRFESNVGQTDPRVQFMVRGHGYTLFLTPSEDVFVFSTAVPERPDEEAPASRSEGVVHRSVLRMSLVGADPDATYTGAAELETRSNYFLGAEPATWHTDVPNFGTVRHNGVYPGIDLHYYGAPQLEYDFEIAPGADPSEIRMHFSGARQLTVSPTGGLVIDLTYGSFSQSAPTLYQEYDGVRHLVEGTYVLLAENQVGFSIGTYDTTRPLVLDPAIDYASFLGGASSDGVNAIVADSANSAYVTGYTTSSDFPTSGAYDSTANGTNDVFVTKFNSTGSNIVYSTYIGGSSNDAGHGIDLDAFGAAFVVGTTQSTNFPTASAYDATQNGSTDAFVLELSSAGNVLAWSTYIGGSGLDGAWDLVCAGAVLVTGYAESGFPTSAGAYDTSINGSQDVFVASFSYGGAYSASTFVGGTNVEHGYGIATDGLDAFVCGYTTSSNFPATAGAYDTSKDSGADAFALRLNNTLTTLRWCTFLGGSSADYAEAIEVDGIARNAYVVGYTASSNYPTTGGAYQTASGGGNDVFVTKVNAGGATLAYSTYIGGSGDDQGRDIAIDADSPPRAYLTGMAGTGFPTTAGAFATTYSGSSDGFFTKLNGTGTGLGYSTFMGGTSFDTGRSITYNANIFLGGETQSTNFPTWSPTGYFPYDSTLGGTQDGWVAKFLP